MKRIYAAVLLSLLGLYTSPVMAALDRVGDFALLDSSGEFHQLSRYQHRKALVLMAYDHGCDAMASLLANYQAISSKYSGQGIEFLLIDSLDLGRAALLDFETDLPILEDDGQLVSETLGIERAGDVLVLNPVRLSLYYRGPMAGKLDGIVAGVLTGAIENTEKISGSGCEINYPVKAAHQLSAPDYTTEVAPIIVENCADCHRQGGVGPFALDSYIMVLGWSPMIREVLLNKRMPPTQVDPYVGHSENARYLSTQELQTLIHWIDARAPRGDGEFDPLEQLEFDASTRWQLGEPDYIVTAADNEVAATGVMDYLYDHIELPFTEDKWISAVQYQAGDQSVLHHLMTFVTAPDEDFWGAERQQESVTRRFVEGYAPGDAQAIVYPRGTGVKIPQGHGLSMQFHYVTNGQATVDTTRLGLYFSDEPALTEILSQVVSPRFVLPPNQHDFAMQAQHLFEEAVVIIGVRPRMGYRGKKMKFAVEQADGSLRDIFSVPAYNYGWQPHYLLQTPVVLPAGSRVHVIGAFDNSISNPSNPDPDKEVRFGVESWDEMFTGYISYYKSSN
ncbi:MAG: hypothetical protein IIB72_07255 [Proteobacteria bacterium]|nr:hypothetical protein [Pseudomonadota bacterium]